MGITLWILQFLSVPVTSTASSIHRASALIRAMGECCFGALLVAVGLNSGRHSTWTSSGAAPGNAEPRPGAALGVLGRHLAAIHWSRPPLRFQQEFSLPEVGVGYPNVQQSSWTIACPVYAAGTPPCLNSWSQAPKCRSRLHDSKPCSHSDQQWQEFTSW